MLRSIGYVTGIFGKWHLGHHKKFLPLQQGFDEYFGLPYSNDMWPADYEGSSVSGTDHFKSFYPQLPLIEGNEKIEEIRTLDDQDQLTTRYTERAVDFITNNKDRPFFLYLPHSMPHVPLGVSNKFRNKSEQGMYGDVIMEIDWSVGEILNALSDNDLDDNTVVIFASDNGPWLNYGNHAGSAFPLREGKGTMWEGGSRVPCIIRWPGRITAGSVSHQLAATIDILPTIASITGAALPARPIDGVSIQAILEGDTSATPREEYYYYYGGELIAVRKGKMKLVFPHSYRSYAGIDLGLDGYPGIYKGVLGKYAVGKSKLELYDLDNDMSESKDVSEMYPDVVKTLQVLGQKAREELGDRLTGTIGTGVRPIGRLDPERSPSYLEVSHKAVNRPVTIKNQYSEKYSAGGDNGVVNGIRGTIDFHDGNWQGYEGVDFEAIIDLGETTVLSEISSSFLQNQSAWIFFPTEVEFEISTNGFDFSSVKRVHYKTKISPSHEVINFSHVFSQEKARFVKVKAKNVTICPDWHPGAGGEAWIFVDEIVVK